MTTIKSCKRGGKGDRGLSSEIHNTVENFLPKITAYYSGLTFLLFYGILNDIERVANGTSKRIKFIIEGCKEQP